MPLLSREIDSLINLSSFYSTMFWSEIPDAFAEAQTEHLEMIEVCRQRDAELARKLMQDHLSASSAVQVRLARTREESLRSEAPIAAPVITRKRKTSTKSADL